MYFDILQKLLKAEFDVMQALQDKEGFSEMVAFLEKYGLSIQAAEFPEVKEIIEGKTESGPPEQWSDQRFPKWIENMREA